MNKESKARVFVRIWQTAADKGEVVKRTKMTWDDAKQRAHYYRSKGVPLRKFTTARNDWGELAELAKSFLEDK